MKQLIDDLLAQRDVEPERLEAALHEVMTGGADPIPTAGLLVALRARPVDGQTLAALARVLRRHRVAVTCQVRPLIDTCGTGGDGSGSFNISTAAALVVAAAGAAVAKHGNRGVSSKTGSADVLESAGVALDLGPQAAAKLIDAAGFAFLFAPRFHPAMAHVMPVRRALGVRTHFNLLGPLSNPALAEFQLLGVYAPDLTRPMAEALLALGTRGALVVHCDGLDEIGLHAVTRGHRVVEGVIEEFAFDPRDLGLQHAPNLDAIAGGDAAENNAILQAVLRGEDQGARADIVALNAGAALWIGGLAKDLDVGYREAHVLLRQGAAARVLDRVVASSTRLSEAGE